MSYDINLCDPVTHDVLELDDPHDMRGGTYAMGGTREAHLNVTYNYAGQFTARSWRERHPHDLRHDGRGVHPGPRSGGVASRG